MKILITTLFFLLGMTLFGAVKPKLYLIPGQGSKAPIFNNMNFEGYEVQVIDFLVPEKKEKMAEYAQRMSQSIDTTVPFCIIGVSLGGMLASEMSRFLKPHKVFLISSAKCRDELPFRYRWGKYVPLYKLFPGKWLRGIAVFLQPLVEPDSRNDREVFKGMLKSKDPKFMKRSIGFIVGWQQSDCNPDVIHFHGNNDHTLPYKRISNAKLIEGGSHMMAYTKGEEIAKLILATLKEP